MEKSTVQPTAEKGTAKLKYSLAAIVAFIFALVFYYSCNIVRLGDDLCYTFSSLYEEGRFDSYQRIDSFSDIFATQFNDYFAENGRFIIHCIVILFLNILGSIPFAIANGFMYLCLIFLTLTISFPGHTKDWRAWLLCFIVYWYLFPYSGDIRIGGMHDVAIYVNYLWSAVLFLLFWIKFHYHSHSNKIKAVMLILLSFVTGWSNEAFALPLSASLFLCWAFRWRKYDRLATAMLLALLLGTAFLVLAPGNFHRAMSRDASMSIIEILTGAAKCFLYAKIFWTFVLVCIIMLLRRRGFIITFFKEHIEMLLIILIGSVFSIYAHHSERTLTCVELASMLLLYRLAAELWHCTSIRRHLAGPHGINTIAAFALLLATVHQSVLAAAHHRIIQNAAKMIEIYKESPDGITYLEDAPDGLLIKPYIFCDDMYVTPNHYASDRFSLFYGCPGKYPLVFSKQDYVSVIENPDNFFIDKNIFPGTAKVCEGDNFYFLRNPDTSVHGKKFIAYYNGNYTETLSTGRRLLYKVLGRKQAPKELEMIEVNTPEGLLVALPKTWEKPTRIDIED